MAVDRFSGTSDKWKTTPANQRRKQEKEGWHVRVNACTVAAMCAVDDAVMVLVVKQVALF